ncbi:hypothetical protein J3Q00_20415 [Pseudomonas sp. D2-3]
MRSLISTAVLLVVLGGYFSFSGYINGAGIYDLLQVGGLIFLPFWGAVMLPALYLDWKYGCARAKALVVLFISALSTLIFVVVFYGLGWFSGGSPAEVFKFSLWVMLSFFLFLQFSNVLVSRR